MLQRVLDSSGEDSTGRYKELLLQQKTTNPLLFAQALLEVTYDGKIVPTKPYALGTGYLYHTPDKKTFEDFQMAIEHIFTWLQSPCSPEILQNYLILAHMDNEQLKEYLDPYFEPIEVGMQN